VGLGGLDALLGSELLARLAGAVAMALAPLIAALFLIGTARSVIRRMQRLGAAGASTHVGPFGRPQTVAGAIKLLTKALIIPKGATRPLFVIAPMASITAAISVWAVIPLGPSGFQVVDLDFGVLYVVAISSLAPLSVMMAGWSSCNPYAELGALHAVSRTLSYEAPQILALLAPVLLSGSLSLQEIIWSQEIPYVVTVPLAALVFLGGLVAEMGRPAFQLSETDSGLVADYAIAYSGMMFGAFHLAAFIQAFTTSVLFVILFLGGWRGPWVDQIPLMGVFWMLLKAFLVFHVLMLLRAALPRLRIDQVLALNWRFMVPLGLTLLMVVALVDKMLVGFGITGGWPHTGGLLLANLAMAAVLVVFLFGNGRGAQRRQAQRPDLDVWQPR
jgi:NADH-quinone oxidoreductase subunit H